MFIVDLNGSYVVSSARTWIPESRWISTCGAQGTAGDFPWRRAWIEEIARGLLRTNGSDDDCRAPVLDGSGADRPWDVIIGRLLTPAQVQMIGARRRRASRCLRNDLSAEARMTPKRRIDADLQVLSDVYGKPLRLSGHVPRRSPRASRP